MLQKNLRCGEMLFEIEKPRSYTEVILQQPREQVPHGKKKKEKKGELILRIKKVDLWRHSYTADPCCTPVILEMQTIGFLLKNEICFFLLI